MTTQKFSKLFEPVTIGTMQVKNRIVMCPIGSGLAYIGGAVSERMIDYYTERAKAGVGLIIVEGTCVEGNLGMIGMNPRLLIDHDHFIAGFYELAESVHHYGTKIVIQLQHGGRWATLEGGKQMVSASECFGEGGVTARALTIPEIKELEEAFAEGARRARVAGVDGIAINGGAGLLITQFLSRLTNKRTDIYGGELEGRMRFLVEIIGRVQQKAGKDFPIIFDHPVDEFLEGGINLEESKEMARRLDKLGVAAFRIHSGVHDPRYMHWIVPPASIPQGLQVHYAEATKKVLSQAKVMVGRQIQDPDYANSVIEEGKADLIVLGRPLLADPEVAKKWAEGRVDDVRRCIRCNHCIWYYFQSLPLSCPGNAALGKERLYRIVPAEKPKRVLVAGGGPGGMEAARVAALRGHKVTLYEKSDRLGGQLNLACIPPYKSDIKGLTQYLVNQTGKLGVKVKLGKEVTKELVREEKPDVVILATGATPQIPDIPGVQKKIVSTAWDILAGKAEASNRVIVVGGGRVGCEVAEFLAEKGKKVTIVARRPDTAPDVEPITRMLLLQRLAKLGVNILTNMTIDEITDKGVVVIDRNWQRQTIEAETVVLARGATPNKQLEELKKEGMEVYSIGDCVSARSALEAIHEGYWISSQI